MILPGIGSGLGALVASGSGSGGGVGSVALSDQSFVYAASGAPRTLTYRLNTAGTVQRGKNGTYNTVQTWLLSGASSDYEARVTDTGGGLTSGTIGSWVGLGSTRDWAMTDSVAGDGGDSDNFYVEIRQAAPPNTVLASANISFYVEAM